MPRCHRVAVQLALQVIDASFARVSRFGLTSGVDMLREVSIAKMISFPGG